MTLFMHYVTLSIKIINFTTTKYLPEDNFYEVQMTKCTKTLYQTGTIHPTVHVHIAKYKHKYSII